MGVTAVAAGWGTVTEEGKVSCTLQEVEVPVLSNQKCRSTKYTASMISDNMMCAGYPETGGKDSCQVCYINHHCYIAIKHPLLDLGLPHRLPVASNRSSSVVVRCLLCR